MDLDRIVADLKSERDRIGRAINALLEGAGLTEPTGRSPRKAVAPKRPGPTEAVTPNQDVKVRHTNVPDLQDPRFTKEQLDKMTKAASAKYLAKW